MNNYKILSRYAAQGLMFVYALASCISGGENISLLGTISIILITVWFDFLYKKTVVRTKEDLENDNWNGTKFVFFEKLNLYSKVYCAAGLLGIPMAFVINPSAQLALIMITFIGLLIFSASVSKKYYNKRLDLLKSQMRNKDENIFAAN